MAEDDLIEVASWGKITVNAVLSLPAPPSSASSSVSSAMFCHCAPTVLTTTAKLANTLAKIIATTGSKPPKGLANSITAIATTRLGSIKGTVISDLSRFAP